MAQEFNTMNYNEYLKQIADRLKAGDAVTAIQILHDIEESGYKQGYEDCNAAYELMIDYRLF